MNEQQLQEVIDRIDRAWKFGLRIGQERGLLVIEGYYCPPDREPLRCTIAEAIVIGEEASGDVYKDAARVLGTTADTICGFEAGVWFEHGVVKRG